jgi:hypothetical protein
MKRCVVSARQAALPTAKREKPRRSINGVNALLSIGKIKQNLQVRCPFKRGAFIVQLQTAVIAGWLYVWTNTSYQSHHFISAKPANKNIILA